MDFREVALALAGAARAAGVDTARWIDSLRDGEAANDDEALLEAYTDTSVGCAQCGKGFVSKEYLAQHVKSVHGDVERKPTSLPTTVMRNVGKHSPRPKSKKKKLTKGVKLKIIILNQKVKKIIVNIEELESLQALQYTVL